MKKVTIGALLMFHGTLISMTIIILASRIVPEITEWRGTKLWFVIYGAKDMDYAASLFLGTPFTIGVIIFTLGFIVIIAELLSSYRHKP